MKLKIIYIITGLSTGGAEVSLIEICDEALRHGHEVLIISLTKPSPEFILRFDERICILTINLRLKSQLVFSLYRLSKVIKEYNPDIIHSHMIHANLFSAFCKSIGIIRQPLLATAHSLNEGRFSGFYRLAKIFYNYTIHISNPGLYHYVKKGYFNKHQSIYIPNGINVNQSDFSDLNKVAKGRFITLGRLVKLKNHKLMIDAVINAHEYYPDITLSIFGAGPCYEELKEYILNSKAENYIFLNGETSNPRFELSKSNYFLLSSDWEGMPISLLEACAEGLPCAVTDVGSCKEVLAGLPLCFTAEAGNINQYYSNVVFLAATPLNSLQAAKPIIRERIVSKYSINNAFQSLYHLYLKSLNNTLN